MHPPKEQILTECIDLIAVVDYLPEDEHAKVYSEIIETLGTYPKPQEKGNPEAPTPEILGAYLCASSVRNACKLTLLGYLDNRTAKTTITDYLTNALTLLIES
ncbi:hypothetical protein JSO56_06345 [Riemerella anatipestifer]|uniref:hypothetical protein n=1 Tax=Riemerella anatipestifer TaxID=34085 RepID=UPI0030BA36AA